ncbi:beta-ketoacyl-[acyl-carrier-protein] synthase family protein [Achromobacter spanius]|uniref:beta-ketoacyl-[acyl-carrier-protein] synthase family protein n=1 Tax=Achromobacter spanius TaxID=217203 RepID=UPI003817EA46
MNRNRVFITAVGMATPLGNTAEKSYNALMAGECGVGKHSDASIDKQVGFIREPLDVDASPSQLRSMDRVTLVAQYAADQALAAAGLSSAQLRECGVFVGTGIGGVSSLSEAIEIHHGLAPRRTFLVVPSVMPNAATAQIAQTIKTTAEAQTYTTACSAGAVAIGEAFRRIRDGYLDLAIAGGTESMLTETIVTAWKQLHVLCADLTEDGSAGGCRPFSARRSGFALAEGAAMLVLESEAHARARNAVVIAEVVGYGVSNDGTHPLRPDDEGQALAMSRCLSDAGLTPGDIDYINAHGTGTYVGDRIETSAIKRVFGDRAKAVPVSSIKGALGHTIGAAGAIEAVVTALSLQRSQVPPTLFFEAGDEACDLDYVPNVSRDLPGLRTALSNSFGMGGNNAVLAFKAAA